MPTKFCGFDVQLPANGYFRVDTIDGLCDITVVNNTNGNIFIVTNAGNATEAATEETAGRYMIISQNTAGVYTFRANPSRTWVEWQGTVVGTPAQRHSCIVQW